MNDYLLFMLNLIIILIGLIGLFGLLKDIPMEWMRFPGNTETAPNTYSEVPMQVPVSKTENLAMLIHKVEFQIPLNLDVAVELDTVSLQLASNPQTTLLNLDDSDLLHLYRIIAKFVTSGLFYLESNHTYVFDPPLLYAKSRMFFGIQCAGQTAAKEGFCRVGYTLEKVDSKTFINALVD